MVDGRRSAGRSQCACKSPCIGWQQSSLDFDDFRHAIEISFALSITRRSQRLKSGVIAMKIVLKIVGGIVVLLMLAVGGLVASLYMNAATPTHPVGFMQVAVRDPDDKPLQVGIWYPTDSHAGTKLIGLSMQKVAGNGNVAGRDLPLIVISHGNYGLLSSHSDTALALASAGFVVAAVTHTGDNVQDQSYVGTPRWLIDRQRHIHLVLDYMLSEWPAHRQIDPARIGMFGFSAGGFTALVSIGGVPDLAQIGSHCKARPEFACTLWKQLPLASAPDSAWIHDARIKAAVIAAPGYGFAFEPNGLSHVTAAVQLWNGTDDSNVPYATNEAVVRKLLPTPPDYHAVPGAAHFSFLAPCPSWLFPLICKDAHGFDRRAFHRDFDSTVVAFFQSKLAPR
jgi:predicted dienelactone hydrolase